MVAGGDGEASAPAGGATNISSSLPDPTSTSTSNNPHKLPASDRPSGSEGKETSSSQPRESPSGDAPSKGASSGPREHPEIRGIGLEAGGEGESPSPSPHKRWEHVEGVGACSEGTVSSESSGMAMASPEGAEGRGKRVPALEAEVEQLRRQLHAAIQEVKSLKGLRKQSQSLSPVGRGQGLHAVQDPPLHMWRDAWEGFVRGFSLAYACRAGLALMLRTMQLARQRKWADMHGWQLLSEKKLVYREDAVRLGLFFGGFTGIYRLLYAAMARQQASTTSSSTKATTAPDGRACFTAGAIAGIVLLVHARDRRRTIALYAAARLAQCWYNSHKASGRWHFWGSDWNYGDALLFAIASAQIMYAYVMRPETLPEPFWKFIVRSGPVPAPVLEAVRRNNRGLPIDVAALNQFLASKGGRVFLSSPFPSQVPIGVLNPGRSTVVGSAARAAAATFRKTFPLYLSLTLVPSVVFNLARAVKAPLATGMHAVGGALQSTAFLSTFVGIYQATVSAHRTLFKGDSKYLYWLAGLAASSAILIERKSRRAELALYVAPRAVDSVLWTLLHNRMVPSIPFGEVALFALSMGGLMYYRVCEPDTMAPFLKALISRIVFGQQPRPASLQRPKEPYIKFSNADFPGTVSSDSSYEDLQAETGSPTSSFEDVDLPVHAGREPLRAPAGAASSGGGRRRSTSHCSFEQVAHPDGDDTTLKLEPKSPPM